VAVALTHAVINTNKADPDYLAQDLSDVYTYKDPRSYPMSMYSYEIVPNQTTAVTTTAKGATLGWLSTNAVCEWQREMGSLGYSPLPMNLVLASLDQLKAIPGIDSTTLATIAATENGVLSGGKNPCNNPTFQPGDDPSHNLLVDKAPFPAGCNAACAAPWKLAGTGVANSGPKYNVAPAKGSNAPTGTDGTTSGKGGKGTKQTCDADTGVCTDATTASSANLKAVPTVITETTGWAGPQTLGVLCALLALLLLLAPPIVNRVLARGRRMKGGGA
jgi:phosphate transport system substrate-binding protein